MRRVTSLVFLGGLLIGGAFAVVACGDSAGAPAADAGEPDSGAPTEEAGIDAIDAGPDAEAGPVDAGPVSVTVLGVGGPRAGVLVVFHDANGAVISSTPTGSDGKVASGDELPAMASVLVANGARHDIHTWVGVQAGDQLVFRDPGDGNDVGAYDVTFSATVPNEAGASGYTVETGRCGTGGDPPKLNLPLAADCVQTTNSVLATARFDDVPVAYSFVKGIAGPNGATTPVTMGAWAVPSTVLVTLKNPPSTPARAVRLAQISEGAAFDGDLALIAENGTSLPYATGFAEALQANLFVDGPTTGIWRGLAKRVSPGTALELDFANPLPELSNPTVGGTDVRRPVFAWTGAPADASGGIVRVLFTGPQVEEGYVWTFVVPPGQASVTAPSMPEAAASFLPPAGAAMSVFSAPDVGFIKSELLPTYTAFRRVPGVGGHFPGTYFLPPLTQNGTFQITAMSRVGGLL
jgi:hypothetical protein